VWLLAQPVENQTPAVTAKAVKTKRKDFITAFLFLD
jgi:hypothetical protein